MRLLTRTIRDLRRFLGPGILFSCGVLLVLAALEAVGRSMATDVHDLAAASMLGLLALVVGVRHRQAKLGWVSSLGGLAQSALDWLRGLKFEIGIDLRGTPPLPFGMPRAIRTAAVVLSVWAVLALALVAVAPQGLRAVATRVWYTGYLLLLVGLWAALVFAIVIAVFIPVAMIHDRFVGSFAGQGRRSRRLELLCISAYFSVAVLGIVFLPLWLPLVVSLLALAVNVLTIAVPSNPDVKFLWRPKGGSEIRSISWGRWVAVEFTLVTLVIVDLVITACGSVVLGLNAEGARELMPITTTLGQILAWLAPGALCGLVLQTVIARLRDPARPAAPVVHVAGERLAGHRSTLRRLFAGWGWRARFARAKPDPLDVCVRLDEQADPRQEMEPRWPLAVRPDLIEEPEVRHRLARRDEIQKRRRLISGLERLFKRAARRRYRAGSGFWIAPHYWFIPGLTRDSHEDEMDLEEGTVLSGVIGPPYHRALPRAVRHHVYTMLRALQVDLIFVEDGVGFRRFVRVLRVLFELFDVHGGRKRAEEIHFTGLPGTRVMIHEFVLDEPFKSDVYPEPDYENLGRARILHIFRDRGEQTDPLETPFDFTNAPVPVLAR
jgi:hypothetical protein